MKIYARQIAPEYQESPLFYGDWPENVFVFGNRHFNEHAETVNTIKNALYELLCEWDAMQAGRPCYDTWADAINDYFPAADDGRKYTRAERLKIAELAHKYADSDDDNIICAALELIASKEYESATIRGCCQGDWQNIIYPAEYGREWLNAFETEYFNTGSEWMIHDGDDEPDDPNDISGWCMYAYGWNDAKIKEEIADEFGGRPEDVILYEYAGSYSVPKYNKVGV